MSGIHLYESKHQESYALRIHHHPNFQFLYVIEGTGSLLLNGRSHPLGQDHAVLIQPYTEHAVSSDAQLTVLVLAFDDGMPYEPACSETPRPLFAESELLRLNAFSANELRLLLRKLLYEQSQKDPLSGLQMKLYVQELLLLLARARGATQAADANALRAERIHSYIDLRYYEPLTADDLAFKLGVGTRHANNIFKERYGITPMQYLTEARIRVAKKLLVESDKDIVSICFEVGYESVPTFYRAFKNTVGLSPNKFRQQHQEIANAFQ
ncbi:AraC family transcriptional regulator [Paenibacillus filicis]|uniref:AraC family transcriptional regulator n=1 Tax=Paenibacillus gyeongsangnamensis TaxID=3388067 RepID=A0ABT4Q500_9BACL|nr:AraC family transcriptional regulator [Paenibacillus filicis]MCZ8511954.1 AraC family transcriptional regulator [Paenibacillus filicis]